METEKQADSTQTSETFDIFAVVELMGRQTIAGRVCEVLIAGKGMLRVDVPAVGDVPAFTKFFAPTAIWGITPVTEETATEAARQMRVRPIRTYIDASRQLESRERFDDDDYDQ